MEKTTSRRLSPLQIILLIVLAAAACLILRQSYKAPYRTAKGSCFGTSYMVKYKWAEELDGDIRAALQSVDESLSMFNDSSVLSRINRGETVETDAMFREVYEVSNRVSQQTGGYFDVTVKPLVDAWGFGVSERSLPTDADIDSLLSFVGYEKLQIRGHKVVKADPRLTIDFGAVAKGYACDVVAKRLRNLGLTDFIVEIGGEIVCYGDGERGKGWIVGISKPVDDSLATAQELQTMLQITNRALATSGNYHRYYYADGRKVSHTINPHTGRPAAQSILSSTVVATRCATADAYATAFMACGLDSAKAILARLSNVEAYLIYADSTGELQTWSTDGFSSFIIQ